MNGPQPPCIDAGLYWIDEPERLSFQRTGEYLILELGLQFSGNIGGGRCAEEESHLLATLAHATDKQWPSYAAASEDELLHLLADPTFFVRDIRFVGIQRAYAKSAKAKHLLPGKIGLSFDVMSDEAIAHGDHAAVQVYWSEEDIHLSSALFADMCRRLRPTYADLEGEGILPCLYDMVHNRGKPTSRPSVSYCDDGFLGSLADEYWSTFRYTERMESGAFGSDTDIWWNRRWKLSKARTLPDSARWRRRNELFGQAVKRAYRGRFSARLHSR